MSKKKILLLVAPIVVLLSLISLFIGVFTHLSAKGKEIPYITLIPRKDGNAFTLFLRRMDKNESLDYEITYTTEDNIEQGIIGKIDKGSEYYEKEHLFGTCSTKTCRYDKGVEYGKFKANLNSANDNYPMDFDFHLQKIATTGGMLTQKDATLEISKDSLPAPELFFISHPTGGLPVSVKEKIVAGPLGFFSSDFKLSKDATLTINLLKGSPKDNLAIWGWEKDDKKWIEYSTEIKDQKAVVKVNLLTTYIVVEK